MPQIQGIEGEAVVLLRQTLDNAQVVRSRTSGEMRYPRLSRRVNNRTNQERFNDATFGGFQIMGHKARENPTYLGFLQASSCYLCNIRVISSPKIVILFNSVITVGNPAFAVFVSG